MAEALMALSGRAVAWLLYPVLIFTTGYATMALLPTLGLVVTAVVLWTGALVLLIVIEAMVPRREEWRRADGQLLHDFGHAALGSALGSGLGGKAGDLVVEMVVVSLALNLSGPSAAISGSAQWWLGAGLIYVAVDYARYWQHRLTHHVQSLWVVHHLHHDADRLIAIKAGRSHPLDRALQALCVVPVVLIGAPPEMVAWCVVTNSIIGLIGHANLDLKLGPLGAVLVGPAAHRVHHASDHNFGASLIIWDRLFGTYLVGEPQRVGLNEPTEKRFVAQLAAPLHAWAGRRVSGIEP